MTDWKLFALGSAFFAGLTAVFAKVGVKDIPSNLATLIRTVVIIAFVAVLVWTRGEWRNPLLINRRSLICNVARLVCAESLKRCQSIRAALQKAARIVVRAPPGGWFNIRSRLCWLRETGRRKRRDEYEAVEAVGWGVSSHDLCPRMRLPVFDRS